MKIRKAPYITLLSSLLFLSGCDSRVYTLEKIGGDNIPYGAFFKPWTLNNAGTVVGNPGGVVYENGEFIDRPDLVGAGWDINQQGTIVGGIYPHAFMSVNGETISLAEEVDLSAYSWSYLMGVNEDNIAVGVLLKSSERKGFIFEDNDITIISPCAGELTSVTALDINDNGTIVGYCSRLSSFETKGFVRYNGEYQLLDFIDSDWHIAVEVNEHDTVVGSYIGPDDLYHAFKYHLATGEFVDIGIVDGGSYMDINNNGVTIILGDNENYVHSDKGGLRLIEDLLKPNNFQKIYEITGINDSGSIVGEGRDELGNNSGFILTPNSDSIYAGK